MKVLPNNWPAVFLPETPILELVARSAVLYLAILLLMRFMLRRSASNLAVMDMVFLLLLVNAAARSFGDYTSVGDGLISVLVIMALDYAMNFLTWRSSTIERLMTPPPLAIIRNGKLLRHNMRREFLTEEELMGKLRQKDVDDVRAVKAAFIESDGSITVIHKKEGLLD